MLSDFYMMAQSIVHTFGHVLLPGIIALLFFRSQWKRAWLIMLATMLVDLDHFLAWPDVFVPDRCSIGFHPLHSYPAIGVYIVLLFFQRFRLIGLGLVLHMITDWQDCLWM